VGPVVVDERTATTSVGTVGLGSDHASAAHVGPGVVDGGTTTPSVGTVGLGTDRASAADLGGVVVDGGTAAAGIATIRLVSQPSIATDILVTIARPADLAGVTICAQTASGSSSCLHPTNAHG